MKIESRSTIHAGVGFVMTPFTLERNRLLVFQQRLLEIDSNFSKFEIDDSKFLAMRLGPVPTALDVRLEVLPAPNVGRLAVVASNLVPSADLFSATATTIAEAYEEVWSVPVRQVLLSEVTLRDLYDADGPHAFMDIWERRLQRKSEELVVFNQPIVGGGVRFVLAPKSADEPIVDLKIESQLDNPRKIFIEIQCTWQNPTPPGIRVDPTGRLKYAQEFAKERAIQWVSAETKK